MMQTCQFCGCAIEDREVDAFGHLRWVRNTAYGDERICGARLLGPTEPHSKGYHEPHPLPDLTSPTAVAAWLEV